MSHCFEPVVGANGVLAEDKTRMLRESSHPVVVVAEGSQWHLSPLGTDFPEKSNRFRDTPGGI